MAEKRFAADTKVPVDRTRSELDQLLARHGASQRGVYQDDDNSRAIVQFRMAGRVVRLAVKLPKLAKYPTAREEKRLEQEARTAWRRLLLVVKAKLELVADGTSSVEREFLADILLPDGKTVHELLAPQLQSSYANGKMPPLLGSGS